MPNYIDGFVLPIPTEHIEEYKQVASQVATIWKEHGAIEYTECIGDDFSLEGVRSFAEFTEASDPETVIFGWVVFPSKEIRDTANRNVPNDPRMGELVAPLVNPNKLIFDAKRMVYGGFKSLVQSNK